ncbi:MULTISPECIES: hypothetical protein [unclassified Bradyrhizobium]|uniref:hypothetical protein n=1 Tax=unclassified Bradyrhizobium TaxID=2631580 RepID=UPI001FF819C8|nr:MULTISPECIES: hypothetical protein [unclassified Bradyrhizobium]MCK1611052.1 hypothetical protein [Bradyrhizobium sp. 163]MCK1762806.1 hypothetical protein [Bradyrhizobium sp. 136]
MSDIVARLKTARATAVETRRFQALKLDGFWGSSEKDAIDEVLRMQALIEALDRAIRDEVSA